MTSALFGVNELNQPSFSFDSPVRTFCASQIEDVAPLLKAAENEAQRGAYVALMLSYEAAAAFDPVLQTHSPTSFPLAWAAVFDRPTEITQQHQSYTVESWTPQISQTDYNSGVERIR